MSALSIHRVGYLLRKARLLRGAYPVAFMIDYIRNYRANARFRVNHPDFKVPPPAFLYETTQSTSLQSFYDGGLWRAKVLDDIAEAYLPNGPIRICEWGCGPARVIRHFQQINSGRYASVHGTDYNCEFIAWCRTNIPDVHFDANDLQPPLAYPEKYFDFLYNISVLTHIPRELQLAWVNEGLRVLKPGGILFLTVHGDSYKKRLLHHERKEYETEGIVVRGQVKPGWAWYTAYHNPRFVREQLLGDVEIVHSETFPEGHPQCQDRWIVRKPA